jgi:hypothetical protein
MSILTRFSRTTGQCHDGIRDNLGRRFGEETRTAAGIPRFVTDNLA